MLYALVRSGERTDTMSTEQDRPAPAEDFATLLARARTRPALQEGQVVKGRVIQIGEDIVLVEVQGSVEAVIARAELEDEQGNLQVSIGDEVEATVMATENEVRLSRKLLKGIQAREQLGMA